MRKNTIKNREKLAAEIVEQMDLAAMVEQLKEQSESFYEGHTDEEFYKEWKIIFGED